MLAALISNEVHSELFFQPHLLCIMVEQEHVDFCLVEIAMVIAFLVEISLQLSHI